MEHESGGAQFASRPTQKGETQEKTNITFIANNYTYHQKEDRAKEASDLRGLGKELDTLEDDEDTAKQASDSVPLMHIDLKHSVPKTPEAALAKQKRRNCFVCV